MKTAIIIGIIIVIIVAGVFAYSLLIPEQTLPANNPDSVEPSTAGENLSINLQESVGIEANP